MVLILYLSVVLIVDQTCIRMRIFTQRVKAHTDTDPMLNALYNEAQDQVQSAAEKTPVNNIGKSIQALQQAWVGKWEITLLSDGQNGFGNRGGFADIKAVGDGITIDFFAKNNEGKAVFQETSYIQFSLENEGVEKELAPGITQIDYLDIRSDTSFNVRTFIENEANQAGEGEMSQLDVEFEINAAGSPIHTFTSYRRPVRQEDGSYIFILRETPRIGAWSYHRVGNFEKAES